MSCDMCVDRVGDISYEYFLHNYLLENRPCILPPSVTKDWICRNKWVTKSGKPNLEYFEKNFGSVAVPVADCNEREYNSQRKQNMKLDDYLKYWSDLPDDKSIETPCLYLKDWHFFREFPNYNAYSVPEYFSSDWLNEYCKYEADDYRFVYMGPTGTWTPLHMDVFGSYSWSANVCGRKKWILFPRGIEKHLLNAEKKLAYSVTEVSPISNCSSLGLEIYQEPGEVVFVPSGWYHQVWNLDDCISVNHNWFNGCNISFIWECISNELKHVVNEISDCKGTDDWENLCQTLLKAHHGMNHFDFLKILNHISDARLNCISEKHAKFDLRQIYNILILITNDANVPEFVHSKVNDLIEKLQNVVYISSNERKVAHELLI